MGQCFSVDVTDTDTDETTMGGLTSAATIRPRIYDLIIGSFGAPADAASSYHLQRYTVAGTSTAVTPQPLEPAETAFVSRLAATTGENHSGEPTYTAAAILLVIPINQRATFRWVAREGKEIILPAVAANGAGLIVRESSSAHTMHATFHEEE